MFRKTVYTLGHSTRSIEEFIGLLKVNGIEQVIDVRTIPKSRHNPQFNKEEIGKGLEPEGIAYVHLKDLGGLRKPKKDSINMGWKNASFRGFADYMQTEEFAGGLRKLMEISNEKNSAIICAEAVPWRCHRSLIADALVSRKIKVVHILGLGKSMPHEITPFAKVSGGKITYDYSNVKRR